MQTRRAAVVVTPVWPGISSGYAMAVRSSLLTYLDVFEQVHLICVAGDEPSAAWDLGEHGVTYDHLPRRHAPRWQRFALSLTRRNPAVVVAYAQIRRELLACLVDRVGQHLRADVPVSVIVEDIPLSYVVAHLRATLPRLRIALRSHNLLSAGFAGMTTQGSPWMRAPWWLETRRIRTFERTACTSVDRLWAITGAEADAYLRELSIKPHGVVGVGLDAGRYAGIDRGRATTVISVGSADLRKGRGLRDFVRRAWPSVRARVPEARLVLAGTGTEKHGRPDVGIVGMGHVADDRAALGEGAIAVNPQVVGAGIQLKSVVAMLAGRALVSTRRGVTGLGGADGVNYISADSWRSMADSIVRLMRDPAAAARVAARARRFAAGTFSDGHVQRESRAAVAEFARMSA